MVAHKPHCLKGVGLSPAIATSTWREQMFKKKILDKHCGNYALVECMPGHPKVWSSSPATAAGTRRDVVLRKRLDTVTN